MTQDKHTALIEALEFYADRENCLYDDFYEDGYRSAFDKNWGSELGDDRGQRARQALSNVKGG